LLDDEMTMRLRRWMMRRVRAAMNYCDALPVIWSFTSRSGKAILPLRNIHASFEAFLLGKAHGYCAQAV
jgi:hypothetical protein